MQNPSPLMSNNIGICLQGGPEQPQQLTVDTSDARVIFPLHVHFDYQQNQWIIRQEVACNDKHLSETGEIIETRLPAVQLESATTVASPYMTQPF